METVPKETETIAHKRALRITEKLKEARARIQSKNNWLSSETVEMCGLLVILLLNFILIFPFIGEEAVSVKFSGPVVPVLAQGLGFLGAPFKYSVQLVNTIFFLIFPLTFYYFVKFVSGRKFAAYLSVLFASLPVYVFAKSRVEFGLVSHESPYIASLAVLPVALIMLLKFLRSGGVNNLIIASVSASFLALISPFGVFVFTVMAMITTFSEILLGGGRIKLLRMITVFIICGGLSAFWYNPGLFLWMLTGPLGSDFRSMLGNIIPLSFFGIPILASLGYLLFDRKPNLQPFFLAIFYSLLFMIVVVARSSFMPSNPGRYIPMFGVSLSFLIGVGLLMGFEHFNLTRLTNLSLVKGTKDTFLILVSLILITITITGRTQVLPDESRVLGAWTEVEKGDIWSARDKINLGNAIPGYAITFITAGSLVYLSRQKPRT